MYPALQKELDTFERRTPKSAASYKHNLKRIPLGVGILGRVARSGETALVQSTEQNPALGILPDSRSVLCKRRGNREADSGSGTGDDRYLSVKSKHRGSSMRRTLKQASAT